MASLPRRRNHRAAQRRRAALGRAAPRRSQRLNPLFYDSHAHLDFEQLADDPAVLVRAFEAGVRCVLVPGVEKSQWARALALSGGALELRLAVGIHPSFEGDVADLAEWADRARAVAIGEVGWDRSAPIDDERVDAHIEVARARDLPVILHVVGAHGHAIERLKRHGSLQGVVHAYSGSAELVREYVKLGLHVSIGPSVLRRNAAKAHAAAAMVPAHRLLIETDAPDQIAEPADLARVAAAVARIRGVSADDIAQTTFDNADGLFQLS